jgi:anti-sigma regulatory factor (Ser/Thr protein kinase)
MDHVSLPPLAPGGGDGPLGQAQPAEMAFLVVNELACNSIRHGGGEGTLRIWVQEGELLCEVRDRGHLRSRDTPRSCPSAEHTSSRGLWIAAELSDRLQIRSSPVGGSAVRVAMAI